MGHYVQIWKYKLEVFKLENILEVCRPPIFDDLQKYHDNTNIAQS